MTKKRIALWGCLGFVLLAIYGIYAALQLANRDPFVAVFKENCSTYHGVELQGKAIGPALVGRELTYGDSIAEISHSISQGLRLVSASGELSDYIKGTPRAYDDGIVLDALEMGLDWPLYSKGVDYDGSPVEYGKELGIEFDLGDIEQPVVDLTPSPAVSSFIFYQGKPSQIGAKIFWLVP